MSLFSDYYLERENIKTFKVDDYFFTYKLTDDGSEFHVIDMYIRPEKRGGASILQLLDKVAELASEAHTQHIISKVDIRTKNPEISLQVMLKLGFKILKSENSLIVLVLPTRKRAI